MLRVSTVPRRDLPGLTWPGRGGAETLYYRFDLGPIVSLPRPIANPDRLRVVFRFPDVERFRASATVRELGGIPPEDDETRHARERGVTVAHPRPSA